jgi:predicted DNA-binding transcriptional regulator YafY
MATTARLYALTEYLRRHRSRAVTVPELARRFDVSERTVFRDLAALRDQHVPIEGEPGRGGGLRLDREYSLPPLNFHLNEAVALWLSTRLALRESVLPWADAARIALDKVFTAMPREERRRVEEVLGRIAVGRPARPELVRSARAVSRDVLGACADAFERSCLLSFRYEDQAGVRSTRTVEPHGLAVMPPLWYLLAVDPAKQAPRTFRLDRIAAPRVESDRHFAAQRPDALFPEVKMDLEVGR